MSNWVDDLFTICYKILRIIPNSANVYFRRNDCVTNQLILNVFSVDMLRKVMRMMNVLRKWQTGLLELSFELSYIRKI